MSVEIQTYLYLFIGTNSCYEDQLSHRNQITGLDSWCV